MIIKYLDTCIYGINIDNYEECIQSTEFLSLFVLSWFDYPSLFVLYPLI